MNDCFEMSLKSGRVVKPMRSRVAGSANLFAVLFIAMVLSVAPELTGVCSQTAKAIVIEENGVAVVPESFEAIVERYKQKRDLQLNEFRQSPSIEAFNNLDETTRSFLLIRAGLEREWKERGLRVPSVDQLPEAARSGFSMFSSEFDPATIPTDFRSKLESRFKAIVSGETLKAGTDQANLLSHFPDHLVSHIALSTRISMQRYTGESTNSIADFAEQAIAIDERAAVARSKMYLHGGVTPPDETDPNSGKSREEKAAALRQIMANQICSLMSAVDLNATDATYQSSGRRKNPLALSWGDDDEEMADGFRTSFEEVREHRISTASVVSALSRRPEYKKAIQNGECSYYKHPDPEPKQLKLADLVSEVQSLARQDRKNRSAQAGISRQHREVKLKNQGDARPRELNCTERMFQSALKSELSEWSRELQGIRSKQIASSQYSSRGQNSRPRARRHALGSAHSTLIQQPGCQVRVHIEPKGEAEWIATFNPGVEGVGAREFVCPRTVSSETGLFQCLKDYVGKPFMTVGFEALPSDRHRLPSRPSVSVR